MLADTGAGSPTTVPSGRKIVTGVLLAALTCATASWRLRGLSEVTSGAMACASTVAVETARSAASVRSTSASGTRNETSTSELVATTSATIRSLIPARSPAPPAPAGPRPGQAG